MKMRSRPAGLAVALLLVTACHSGGTVETTEPTMAAPTTSAPSTTTVPTTVPITTTVLDTDTASDLETTATPLAVAHAFFAARNAYDVEAATALFAPDAHLHSDSDRFITSVDMYPALFEWLRATGWQWTVDLCQMRRGSQYNTYCTYHVENAWSRAMGLAPVQDGVDFEIWGPMDWLPDFKVDQNDSASRRDEPNAQMVEVWDTVTDWIRANHPSDAAAMISGDGSGPVLDIRSIDLWRTYTQEFVEFHAP